jgi:hypothetical protein
VTDATSSLGRELALYGDGSWTFGPSGGTWDVASVEASDWERWQIASYGPQRKIVLHGWNGGTADGPIEESGGHVDFVWVIYRIESPDPATIYLKFGHP